MVELSLIWNFTLTIKKDPLTSKLVKGIFYSIRLRFACIIFSRLIDVAKYGVVNNPIAMKDAIKNVCSPWLIEPE